MFTMLPYAEEDDRIDPSDYDDTPTFICTNCGDECQVYAIDDRFDYEYGDIKGTHGEVYPASCCCDADVEEK